MSRKSNRNVINTDDLAKQIIDFGQTKQFLQLQQLIAKCDIKLVCTVIFRQIFQNSLQNLCKTIKL